MTEISDGEAAEVLWASSEQGKAAVKAALDTARSLGVLQTRAYLTEADIAAVVYAAHLAADGDSRAATGPFGRVRPMVEEGIEAWRDGETCDSVHPLGNEEPPGWMSDPDTVKDLARVIAAHLIPDTREERR